MEARGFGSVVNPPSGRRTVVTQVATLILLLSTLGGLMIVAFRPQNSTWGWTLAALAMAGLLLVFGMQGRQVRRSRYRRARWQARDTAVVAASTIVVAVLIIARRAAPELLIYIPYPPYSLWPPFQPALGAALLLLVLPALLAPRPTERETRSGTVSPSEETDNPYEHHSTTPAPNNTPAGHALRNTPAGYAPRSPAPIVPGLPEDVP
jgi:uncharacterized membrane protein SirB2